MQNENLKDNLDRLHDALAEVDNLDERTAVAMQQVATDINRLLKGDQVASDHVQGIRERLDGLVLDFESEHPKLASVVSQLTDLLAGMGI